MQTFTTLDQALWAAGLLGHVFLLGVLIARRWYRVFPSFLAYAVLEAGSTVLLYFLHYYASRHAYFLGYWISGFSEYPVSFWILYDIARELLNPVKKQLDELKYAATAWVILFSLTFAALTIGMSPNGETRFDLWENRISVFTSLIVCAAIVTISFATNYYGLQRKMHSVGLGLGVFVWSYSVLLNDLAHSISRWNRQLPIIGYAREVLYLGVLSYLIALFWQTEKARPPLSPEMMLYMSSLHTQVEIDLSRLGGPR